MQKGLVFAQMVTYGSTQSMDAVQVLIIVLGYININSRFALKWIGWACAFPVSHLGDTTDAHYYKLILTRTTV